MWFSICCWRPVIKSICFCILTVFHTFFKNIMIIPELLYFLFSLHKVHIRWYLVIHFLLLPFFWWQNFLLKKPLPCNRAKVILCSTTYFNIQLYESQITVERRQSLLFFQQCNSEVIFICLLLVPASTFPGSLLRLETGYSLHPHYSSIWQFMALL